MPHRKSSRQPERQPARQIVACIPYFNCRPYIRRAVESLLQQTHREITVVVINDGDKQPPWDLLADIDDPRLIRFDLAGNHGPYFATAVVLAATSAPYLLIQDADDWGDPRRAAILLDLLEREGTDLAVSAEPQQVESPNSDSKLGSRTIAVRWATTSPHATPETPFTFTRTLGPEYAYRAPHHGLFRTSTLRAIGGYYAGFRVGYDTLLTNLLLMTGRISHIPLPLYYRFLRPESLTHSASTGSRSTEAVRTHEAIVSMYKNCFRHYASYLAANIDSRELAAEIRNIVAGRVTEADASSLKRETRRLKQILDQQTTRIR